MQDDILKATLDKVLTQVFLQPTEEDITQTIQFLWGLLDEVTDSHTKYVLILSLLQREALNNKTGRYGELSSSSHKKNMHIEKILFLLKHKLQTFCDLKQDFKYTCFKKGNVTEFPCICGCDGSFKGNKGSCGFYITKNKQVLLEQFFAIEVTSAFEAEAWALIYTLQGLKDLNQFEARIYTDNQQTVQWLLQPKSSFGLHAQLFKILEKELASLANVEICHVPRELNERADNLTRLAKIFPTTLHPNLMPLK